MEFKTYLTDIEAAIRERDLTHEITLAFTEGSYNRTYDGEWTWRRGKLGARVMRGATPLEAVIEWLQGPNIDHNSKVVVGEDTSKSTAVQIIDTLRRGF